MAVSQVLLVLALGAFCSAMDSKPVSYPGHCPQVPPSAGFHKKDLVKLWRATHSNNPSAKDDMRCATFEVTETPIGVQFESKFMNASGNQETYRNQVIATNTPGLYDVAYTISNGTVYGKMVFYLYDASESTESHESHESHEEDENVYVLSWACIDEPANNTHTECAGILSKRKSTPLSVVQMFQRHLRSHGSPVEEFHQIDNKNC